MNDTARVEVWQDDGGLWRWRYRDDEGVDLLGNESHLTREEAVHAASVAYPGVRIEGPGEPRGRGGRSLAGRIALLLLAVVVAIPVGIAQLVRRLARLRRR